jgi:SH3-like domain-containing protein
MRLFRALWVFGFIFLVVAVSWSSSGMMSVQVKEGQLRSSASFLAPIVGMAAYGDQVEALQQQGDWIEVKNAQNRRGWIHQSAVTKKRVILSAGKEAAPVAASGQEVALAGKGFNAEVESKYRLTHQEVDYDWVNRMEAIRITPGEMANFLKEGGISPAEGGAK